MDWRDIWAGMKMAYVAWQFYARALGTDNALRSRVYNATVDAMTDIWVPVDEMDAALDQTCDLVKASGAVVYGVTVNAPDHGQAVVSSCATSMAHYFEATPESVTGAFEAIASNIAMLKLTQ